MWELLALLITRSEDKIGISQMRIVEGIADHCGVLYKTLNVEIL
jgi:hypothetical protein